VETPLKPIMLHLLVVGPVEGISPWFLLSVRAWYDLFMGGGKERRFEG